MSSGNRGVFVNAWTSASQRSDLLRTSSRGILCCIGSFGSGRNHPSAIKGKACTCYERH
jgi:hypothetical protein